MKTGLRFLVQGVAAVALLLSSGGSAFAWGTGTIQGPGGCEFGGYSQVDSADYAYGYTYAATCSDQAGVRMQYWNGSSWVYKAWAYDSGSEDFIVDDVGTQYMNAYHKIYAYGQWSGTYWTTDPPCC